MLDLYYEMIKRVNVVTACYMFMLLTCACILASSFVFVWLANGVMPCCRLCRLGYCRVIQAGRSAEGSVHGGYTRGRVFVMLCFGVLSTCTNFELVYV